LKNITETAQKTAPKLPQLIGLRAGWLAFACWLIGSWLAGWLAGIGWLVGWRSQLRNTAHATDN
jgi:hypothetical protein